MDSAFLWWEQWLRVAPHVVNGLGIFVPVQPWWRRVSIGNKMLALALWIAVLPGAAWAVPRICSENNTETENWVLESGRCSGRQNGTRCLFQSRPAQDRHSACFQYGVIGTHVKTTFRAISCAQTWDSIHWCPKPFSWLRASCRRAVKFRIHDDNCIIEASGSNDAAKIVFRK